MSKVKAVVFLVTIGSLLLTACGTIQSGAPTQSSATEVPTSVATTAPTPVAQIPPEDLVIKGKLLVCSDIPYPPQEFYDANGNPQGVDIDIAQAIADRLGLQMQVVNSVFDTIIAAVTSGKCDIIVSAMNITPDRNKQVSMIPYFDAGQSMVVQKGNPDNINTPLDVCGYSAAAESGTTEAQYLQGTEGYAGNGLTQMCEQAGKGKLTVVLTQKDTDALQQLQAGKVAAYFTDSPVAGYYVVQSPDQFQVVGQIIDPIVEGIAVPCSATDCTNAPLTAVGQAVKTALDSMMADGTYAAILQKWDLQTSGVSQ
jgi:polar amino acid transport system substrate-binding protein